MKDNPDLVVRVHKNTGEAARANFSDESNKELLDRIAANKKIILKEYSRVEIQAKCNAMHILEDDWPERQN